MTDNKRIAKFMGLEKVQIGYFGVKPGDKVLEPETKWQVKNTDWLDKVGLQSVGTYAVNVDNDYWIEWDDVKYNTSWDWLMPVVEKIKTIGYDSTMIICALPNEKDKMIIHTTTDIISEYSGDSLIESVYKAVVEFIKWYETKKTNPQPK